MVVVIALRELILEIKKNNRKNSQSNIIFFKKDLNKIFKIYKKISPAGVYKAKSIKIAESAKIIENVQRDNIALINEFYLFKNMNLNIRDILDVASTNEFKFQTFLWVDTVLVSTLTT